MTSQYRHRRFSNPATAWPNPLEPGEIAVNTSNRQLAVGDTNAGVVGAPLPLLVLRYFDTRSQYALNDMVSYNGVIYRAKATIPPGPFNASQWVITAVDDAPSDGVAYARRNGDWQKVVKLDGDTMTGPLTTTALSTPLGTNNVIGDLTVARTADVGVVHFGTAKTRFIVYDGTQFQFIGGPLYANGGIFTLAGIPAPYFLINPSTGSTHYSQWYQSGDAMGFATNGIGNFLTFNLTNGLGTVIADPQTDLGIATKRYVDNAPTAAADKVDKGGDEMRGDLTITKSQPVLWLNGTDALTQAVVGRKNGVHRWSLNLGDGTPEGGADTGSDFGLIAFNDGATVATRPLTIKRNNGYVGIGTAAPTSPLHVMGVQIMLESGPSAVFAPRMVFVNNRTGAGGRTYQIISENGGTLSFYDNSFGYILQFGTNGLGTVAGNPTVPMGIATKQYADNAANDKVIRTGDTMTGLLTTAPSTGSIAYSGSAIFQVLGAGGGHAAFMSFHRPGVFAAHFGLDSDNVWRVGGWSYGNVSYQIWHEGNFNAAAAITSDRWVLCAEWGFNIGWNEIDPSAPITAIRVDQLGAEVFAGAARSRYHQVFQYGTWYTTAAVS